MQPSFGKQSSENECAERHRQDTRLGCQNALNDREGDIAENADPEYCRPDNCEGNDECSRCCEDRMAAGCKPQQHWKYQGNWDDDTPKPLREKDDETAQDCQRHRAL